MTRKRKQDATTDAAEQLLLELVDFAQDEKSNVSRAKRIVAQLLDMRFRGVGVVVADAEDGGRTWKGPTARELADGVLTILRHCVDETNEWHGVQRLGQVEVVVSANTDHPPITILGEGDAILGFQVVVLIRFVGVERLRKCDCGSIFLKVGKRQWCSERCQKRVYMRGWWKLHPR